MAASSVYNIIDGVFVGQGVGPEAIMGLALCNPVMSLTAAFGAMVGVGGSTLMSVRLGQKDYAEAQDILDNVLVMNVVMGAALGALLLAFLDPVLRFFGASDVTIGPAHDFMTVILLANIFTHLYFGLNGLLRATNRPKMAMYATFGSVLCNCLLAPLFIFVFHWGIRGAALATVTSQLLMICWQLYLFSDKSNIVHLRRGKPHVRWRIVKGSVSIGLPQFLINLCACLVAIVITRSLTLYGSQTAIGGDVAVGAYGIQNRLILFVVMAVIGLNQGMQPIAGYNYGAQKYDRLIEVLKKALVFATVFTTVGWAVCIVFATPLVTVFAKDSPELIAEAARGLRINISTFPLVGIQIISTAFFQSIGYAGKSIFLSLSRQLLFLLPLLLVLPRLFPNPVDGVWFSLPISDAVAFLVAAVMLTRQVRKFKATLTVKQ
ncbi:MAG: MATE family efflux transporter [Alloprevotella sp.]|nr:MATE family efflux transporter [Alloprevotella sp.]MBR1594913.1 MATE family efflux transporter [Alloprevotella sp.]MBR1651783.1 MATE family efflux transporter [Alloprevotella sp.]